MIARILNKVNMIFKSYPPPVILGRWKLKHSYKEWENYLDNYYGEPGYQNSNKTEWIKKFEKN